MGGKSYVSVMKSLVTQASSAIPVVPLYISILYKIMKEQGTHEGGIEQVDRMYRDSLYSGNPQADNEGRLRLDDWEMDEGIQTKVNEIWPQVKTENIDQLTDFAGYQQEFLKLFGFGFENVDYDADIDPNLRF